MVSWLFIGLVASILLTPGPTNTLLASSGVHAGFRKSILLIPAEAFGYLIAITFWGILVDRISIFAPALPPLLKLCSAAYIFYLALKLWKASFEDSASLALDMIRKRELFVATLLNPKGILFATAIFPPIAWADSYLYISHMLSFLLLLIPIGFFWIYMGDFLNSGKIKWLNQRNLQRTATVILIIFCVPISYSALQGLMRL
ncbi:LysE family translocator [Acinetobacter sp. WZC-1]|uniref:LysE family translocator n=1 Tax=Acinetobacter sp. WZC-1 TaxID=3459034 RepID=UPI00403DD7BE